MNNQDSIHPSLFNGTDGIGSISGDENIGSVEALDAAQARHASNLMLLQHWRAIQGDGITATEFIAFLKPLADLDGITVSHFYAQPGQAGDGRALALVLPDGESGQSTTTKNLTFALNTEGGISVESNFVEL